MLSIILSYFSGLITLLMLDGVMIWFVIFPLFKKYIPTYINTDMNFIASIAFYLFYIFVLLVLIIIPGIEAHSPLVQIFQKSALFGFGAYMTYELTSMSVMKGWSWNMVVVDVSWGTLLTAIIGFVMYTVYKYFI